MSDNDDPEFKGMMEAIINVDLEGFWLLVGGDHGSGAMDPRRRDALMGIVTRAWGQGYERGLYKGGALLAKRVAEEMAGRKS